MSEIRKKAQLREGQSSTKPKKHILDGTKTYANENPLNGSHAYRRNPCSDVDRVFVRLGPLVATWYGGSLLTYFEVRDVYMSVLQDIYSRRVTDIWNNTDMPGV